MSSISSLFGSGGIKPTSIVGGIAAGFTVQQGSNPSHLQISSTSDPIWYQIKSVTSGACTANTLKTILSISGKGALTALYCCPVDTTNRTNRVKVTLDGAVIFDVTSADSASANAFFVHGGARLSSNSGSQFSLEEGVPLIFDQSLLIEYATSLSETDKTRFGYRYYLR